jgi:uncharacterized protein
MNKRIVVMAKRPELGLVKTRLAATMGNDKALSIYRVLLQHTLQCTEPFEGVVYWTGEGDTPNTLLDSSEQSNGDLGHRMSSAIEMEQNDRSGVVVIGTDCPGLSREILNLAMAVLDRNEVVLGPTFDGGYYLIGMKKLHMELFEQMPWSTASVFQLSLDRCRKMGLSVATLPMLSDIDTEEDFIHQQKHYDWLRAI